MYKVLLFHLKTDSIKVTIEAYCQMRAGSDPCNHHIIKHKAR